MRYLGPTFKLMSSKSGLGKRVQTVVALERLRTKIGLPGPFMVLTQTHQIEKWQKEFDGWTKMNVVVYRGTAASMDVIQEYEWLQERN